MPAAIDICSTSARSSVNSGPSAGRARTMVSAAVDDASQANARYPRITTATMAITTTLRWNRVVQDCSRTPVRLRTVVQVPVSL
jgi:hypothetical protein